MEHWTLIMFSMNDGKGDLVRWNGNEARYRVINEPAIMPDTSYKYSFYNNTLTEIVPINWKLIIGGVAVVVALGMLAMKKKR